LTQRHREVVGEANKFRVAVEGNYHLLLDHNSDCDIRPRLGDDASDLLEEAVDMLNSDDGLVVGGQRACFQDGESDEASGEEDLEQGYSGRQLDLLVSC
jgi:hypothetical protein